MNIRYRVVRPGAGIVSRHRKLSAARASLERQQRGAVQQGGFSQDFIEERRPSGWRRIEG